MSADPLADDGLDIGLDSMLIDESGARVGIKVEAFSENDSLEMVLRADSSITWWKSLSYFPEIHGGRGRGPEIRIETKDSNRERRKLLYLPELTKRGVFELWKGGVMGLGAFVGFLPINATANRGRRIIFTWHADG